MEHKEYNKFEDAQRRIKRIKGFYYHLIVFVIFNGVLLISKDSMANALFGDEALLYPQAMNWIYWNIGVWLFILVAQGIYVFGNAPVFIRKWEDRQIKKYMNDNPN